jgi:hypothetical protein
MNTGWVVWPVFKNKNERDTTTKILTLHCAISLRMQSASLAGTCESKERASIAPPLLELVFKFGLQELRAPPNT